MPGNKMEMRVVEWKMEGSLKYTARAGASEESGKREDREEGLPSERDNGMYCGALHAREKGKKTERDRLSTGILQRCARRYARSPPRKVMARADALYYF